MRMRTVAVAFLMVLLVCSGALGAERTPNSLLRDLDRAIDMQMAKSREESLPRVSISAVNQPLGVVLSQVCRQNGFSLTVTDGVNLNLPVSISVTSEPLSQALKDVLDQVGYWAEIRDGKVVVHALREVVLRIPPILTEHEDISFVQGGNIQSSSRIESGAENTSGTNESESQLTTVLKAQVTENGRDTSRSLMASVRGLLSRDGRASLDPVTGLLTVVDHPRYVSRVERFVRRWVSEFSAQVYIEAHIVEVLFNNASEKGIDWSVVRHALARSQHGRLSMALAGATSSVLTRNPAIVISSAWNAPENPAKTVLKALEEQGKVRMVSQPHVLVMSHQVGYITAGDSVPYIDKVERDFSGDNYMTVSYDIARVNEGVTFAVVPHVEGDTVSLSLYPTYSTVKDWMKFKIGDDDVENPVVTLRQTHTKLVLHDGDFVVLGGAQSENLKDHTVKVPLLGDIPLIGWLFRGVSREYTKGELVIMLRVKIIRNNTAYLGGGRS